MLVLRVFLAVGLWAKGANPLPVGSLNQSTEHSVIRVHLPICFVHVCLFIGGETEPGADRTEIGSFPHFNVVGQFSFYQE